MIDRARLVALIAGPALLALSAVLAPWYALGEYRPDGWEATWWVRAAVVLAVATIVLARLGALRAVRVTATTTLLAVAFRVLLPPDFGFGFDGLEVPTEPRAGAFAGLGGAAAAALAAWFPRGSANEPEPALGDQDPQ